MLDFEALPGGGLKVIDELDRRAYVIHSESVLSPTPCNTDGFPFPVDKAVTVETDAISFSEVYGFYIRDGEGNHLDEAFEEDTDYPRDDYYIDVSTSSKTYIRVHDAEMAVSVHGKTEWPAVFTFDRPVKLDIGVRSGHSRPQGVITTTKDPKDMMRAVSYLGSSVKEFSCERSWPTLRGHPPCIELGKTFKVPRDLTKPETGITIEVPASRAAVYAIAPLAFYMGADVIEGESARLVTDTGATFDLAQGESLGGTAHLLLKHCILLDTLVRNGGYFSYPSYEGDNIRELLPFDPSDLVSKSLAEQVDAYLGVPFDVTFPFIPPLGTEVHIDDSPESVELLPFFASESMDVRATETLADPPARKSWLARVTHPIRDALSRFGTEQAPTADEESPLLSDTAVSPSKLTHYRAQATDGRPPIGTNQILPEAFMNRLNRKPTEEGEFSMVIVCNDPEMVAEVERATSEYAEELEDDSELTLDIKTDLSTDELATVLMRDYQFLHYIGHMDEQGFICSDGTLDVRTLPFIGVEGFLLNACDSHAQGVELIRKGGIGGIVTLNDVVTGRAIEMGERLSRMLAIGYPLGPALSLSLEADPIFGGQYKVIGDSNVELRRMHAGEFVFSNHVNAVGPDEYVIDIRSYETSHIGLGGIHKAHSDIVPPQAFLTGATMKTNVISAEEVVEYFQDNQGVVFLPDGSFVWSETMTRERLDAALEAADSQKPLMG